MLVKQVKTELLLDIVNNFISLLPVNYEKSISNIIKELSKNWALTPNLERRIIAFLSSTKHIEYCKNIIIQSKK